MPIQLFKTSHPVKVGDIYAVTKKDAGGPDSTLELIERSSAFWQPAKQWHEDLGSVLWVDDDFYQTHEIFHVGGMNDSDWPLAACHSERVIDAACARLWFCKLPNNSIFNMQG